MYIYIYMYTYVHEIRQVVWRGWNKASCGWNKVFVIVLSLNVACQSFRNGRLNCQVGLQVFACRWAEGFSLPGFEPESFMKVQSGRQHYKILRNRSWKFKVAGNFQKAAGKRQASGRQHLPTACPPPARHLPATCPPLASHLPAIARLCPPPRPSCLPLCDAHNQFQNVARQFVFFVFDFKRFP